MYLNYQSSPAFTQHLGTYQEPRYPPLIGPPIQHVSHVMYPPQTPMYHSIPVQQQVIYPKQVSVIQPPPPVQNATQVYSPNIPINSWHPRDARIQRQYQHQYQYPIQEINSYIMSQQQQENLNQQKQMSQRTSKSGQKIRSNKNSRTSIQEDIDENTPKFATKKFAQLLSKSKGKGAQIIYDKLIDQVDQDESDQEQGDDKEQEDDEFYEEEFEESFDQDDDDNDYDSDLDDSELKERDEIRNRYTMFKRELNQDTSPTTKQKQKLQHEKLLGIRNDKINDLNRFEILYNHQKINKQHANLFEDDFEEDLKMKDIFGDNKIYIQRFNLSKSQKSVPSLIWQRTQQNIQDDEQIEQGEEDDQDEGQQFKYNLWEVRLGKINEQDYLVSYFNNIFSRKSNYLKLGLFYKQAVIKHQYDRTKDIVYYMYTYDEYSIKKKKSEMQEQDQENDNNEIQIKINTLAEIDSDGEDFPSQTLVKDTSKSNKDVLQNISQASKSKLAIPEQSKNFGKSTVFNNNNKSRILNNSQMGNSSLKSKVLTTTTYNKKDVKSQIKDNYDFAKSHFLRDYEKIHGGEAIKEEEEYDDHNESRNKSKSYLSQEKNNTSQHSDNYSKLYKSRPASGRKKVIERKEDDLSKIKNRHNKYKLWEKNAVSEDLFLDQVRDTTIEAVKRARNLEQAIVEKTSIFEHHAASLLNQHLSQLRKVSREYKQELYFKVRDIIQSVYDEYREVINFESNNTYVMLVCDKKDNDRILGIHYHGYQGKKYFERYFDEFVTYNKTRKDFEDKRYQAFLLNKSEESYCKQHFLL